jgi:DNA-3-methyladenine glycosylase
MNISNKDKMVGEVLDKEFYARDTAQVARELLGSILIRKINGETLGGVIVETEAYYGQEDPASRAYRGRKDYNKVMFEEPGHLFIYNVHRYWMLNLIAHEPGGVGGVLIRAMEPTMGIGAMSKNRTVRNPTQLTNGPGKLSLALKVDKKLNGASITTIGGPVYIMKNPATFEVGRSHRIGVKQDLDVKLRFYIRENSWVSR